MVNGTIARFMFRVKSKWGIDMKVGDLVRHSSYHKHIGIVTEVCTGDRTIRVLWHDGEHSWTPTFAMEVLDESR